MVVRVPEKQKIRAKLDFIQDDLGDFDKFVLEVTDYLARLHD